MLLSTPGSTVGMSMLVGLSVPRWVRAEGRGEGMVWARKHPKLGACWHCA